MFFQLIHLHHSSLPNRRQVENQLFNGPKGFMLQLNGKVTSFSIDKSIGIHSKLCSKGSYVGLQSIIKMSWAIIPRRIRHFFQNSFNLLIWQFSLSTSLRMVGCSNFVIYSIFIHQAFKDFVAKMSSFTTNDGSWRAMSRKYVCLSNIWS